MFTPFIVLVALSLVAGVMLPRPIYAFWLWTIVGSVVVIWWLATGQQWSYSGPDAEFTGAWPGAAVAGFVVGAVLLFLGRDAK